MILAKLLCNKTRTVIWINVITFIHINKSSAYGGPPGNPVTLLYGHLDIRATLAEPF